MLVPGCDGILYALVAVQIQSYGVGLMDSATGVVSDDRPAASDCATLAHRKPRAFRR